MRCSASRTPPRSRARWAITNWWGGSCVHWHAAAATSVLTGLLFLRREVGHGERGVHGRKNAEHRIEVRDPEDGSDAVARVHQVEAPPLRLELLEAPDEDADRRRVEVLEV